MPAILKIMGVHGLGDHRDLTWESRWRQAISDVFPLQDSIQLQFCFANYDHVFADTDISGWKAMRALKKLAVSGISTTLGLQRGLLDNVSDKVKWTAGYVVAWAEDKSFQQRTRDLLLQRILDEKPDVIAAHSLGSLISYNLLSHEAAAAPEVRRILQRAVYVTLGSQLGNPFVIRNLTPGRLDALPVKQWYHLYNRNDAVFTSPVRLVNVDNFRQIDTWFDIDGIADHDAGEYLSHRHTVEDVWNVLANGVLAARRLHGGIPSSGSRSVGKQTVAQKATKNAKKSAKQSASKKQSVTARPPVRRALLVGINDYPDAGDRLAGCVNDVFLMSSVLQECGFAPEEIRVCLDARATASGIIERLEWLLSAPQEGDELLFYYSGHGARVPEYGPEHEPDRHCETLVPYDFDWTPETSVSDDRIHSLYSQLPDNVRFSMILDCCHSGGMHRDGGNRIRALNPPDDIRHRSLKWDIESQMWVPRNFHRINATFSKEATVNADFFGADGATTRLGRAAMLRGISESQYKALKKTQGNRNFGPYLPLIIEACGEQEYSYEYRHGVTSYGAFTYSLASVLRRRRRISFKELIDAVKVQLRELQYEQTPQILGAAHHVAATVPWLAAGR